MKNTFRLPYSSGDIVVTRSNVAQFRRDWSTITINYHDGEPSECRFATNEEAEKFLEALEVWYNAGPSNTLTLPSTTGNTSVLVRSKVLHFWKDGGKVVVVMPHGVRIETTCSDHGTAVELLQKITDWMNEA